MEIHHRIQRLVSYWYKIGIENGHYLKDIPLYNLDGNEQRRLYNMAHHHATHSTLLPFKRDDKWVWLDVEKPKSST